jgi:hypothetical protein
MVQISDEELNNFANSHIDEFHLNKVKILKMMSLGGVLKHKNPYLFKAKDLNTAPELIIDILNAYLSSSEEKVFGDFLERLAIFVSGKASGGYKSSAPGVDLEFEDSGIHYLVSIKSGPNWSNSSSKREQILNFKKAVTVLGQSDPTTSIKPVIGICYGKAKTTFDGFYTNIMGQSFWKLISGDDNFYTRIIEPIGYKAKEHNDVFEQEKNKVINMFTKEFLDLFCDEGVINWEKLVEFNSGNLFS